MAQSSQYSFPSVWYEQKPNEPSLVDITRRKRLVFIRRGLEQGKVPNDNICNAVLEAGANPPNQNQYRWLPWMTTLDSDLRVQRFEEKFHDLMNREAKFRHFSVIVCSILFITENDGAGTNQIQNYFKRYHQRQSGVHVFVRRNGNLSFITNEIDIDAPLRRRDPERNYHGFVITLTSIYPVIRHEWQSTGDDRVVYGLNYGVPGQTVDNTSGRYYHRFNDNCLKAYGVNELSKEDILKFMERIGDKPFTAFYVCAGAKLAVVDPYTSETISGKDENHNRVLVQQGGVVIYEGELNVMIHITDMTRTPQSETYTWRDFSQRFVNRISNNFNGLEFEDLTQLVVFLGGIDSDRNSIAWDLTVKNENGSSACYLGIPLHRNRNTIIEAISEGRSGMDEIIARMGYEQLHDSVLTEHGTDFIPVQDYQMLRNILNICGERSLEVTCRTNLEQRELDALFNRELPQEFNISQPCSKFLREPDNEFFKSQMKRKTRAAPPPMYPPIKTNDIIFWPSYEVPIDNVERDCYSYDPMRKLLIGIKHHGSLRARKYHYAKISDVSAFHYERMTGEADQQFWNYSGLYHVSNTNFYRIGVDGWMWQKMRSDPTNVQPSPIYKERTVCLQRN